MITSGRTSSADVNNGNALRGTVMCLSDKISTNNGLWQGENPLLPSFPLFTMQMVVIVFLLRLLRFALKPFRTPPLVSDILGGLLLSPSFTGIWDYYRLAVFPPGSLRVLETIASLGVLYFSFLLGLEIDIKTMLRSGTVALHVAVAGTILPFFAGFIMFFLLAGNSYQGLGGPFLYGVILTVTSFPALAQVLANLKLLHADVGKTAMSSAIINDISSWILLALGFAFSNGFILMLQVLVSSSCFAVLCYLWVGRAISWLISGVPNGQGLTKFQIYVLLSGVMVASFVAEVCGVHSIGGAFLYGASIPNGMIRTVLIEKLEDVVSGLLLPLFYGLIGLKMNLRVILVNHILVGKLVFSVAFACVAKVVSTVGVCFFHNIPLFDALVFGVLMNTKGLLAVLILYFARESSFINDFMFASMLAAIVLMTAMTTPILEAMYKTKRHSQQYTKRTIEGLNPKAELRILTCIYSVQNIPGIIHLLQISNSTEQSPIFVFTLHLIELTGRAFAMLVVQTTRKTHEDRHIEAESDQIADAFEKLGQDNKSISVQPLAAISSYDTMHEDICSYAENKRVALLIIPFHQQQKINGSMEEDNPAIRAVNLNVLGEATCSIGIFLDRGLGLHIAPRIAVLFFGGPDDREALTYAWRMAGCRGCCVTVIRFLKGEDAKELELLDIPKKKNGILTILTYDECQKQLDDQLIYHFQEHLKNDKTIAYSELFSNNGDETVGLMKTVNQDYDLFIVGKGDDVMSSFMNGLSDWTDFPELGPVGNLLVMSESTANASVLVLKQYIGVELANYKAAMAEEGSSKQQAQPLL